MSEAPGAWKYYVTGVSECSQQSSSLKDDGYRSKVGRGVDWQNAKELILLLLVRCSSGCNEKKKAMRVTFTCRHCRWNSEGEDPKQAPSYEAFGRVVIDANKRACPGRQGIVTHTVTVGRPALVDLCARDCLVEMRPSSRFVVVDEEWCKREHLPVVRWLHEQQIHVLTEVEPIDIEGAKQRLRRSYYGRDGKTLLDPRFVGSMSPDNMAEEGMRYFQRGEVCCEYHYMGSCVWWPEPWTWRYPPQTYHRDVHGRLPCIELKKYYYPVLTSSNGEDITGATFRMVMPGGVFGHPPVGCNRAILVVPKNYELPVLDDHEWQQKLRLAHAHQARLSLSSRNSVGRDFGDKVRRVVSTEQFDSLLSNADLTIRRLVACLERFAQQLNDEIDKQAIVADINDVVGLLNITVIKVEVSRLIDRITDFEKTNICIKRLSVLPESICASGVTAMFREVARRFAELDGTYSRYCLGSEFFDRVVCDGVSGLFHRYQFQRLVENSKAKEDLITAYVELTGSLVAIHEKIRALIRAYVQGCGAPAAIALARKPLTSPIFLD